MYIRKLLYLIYICHFFTTIYGIKKYRVLSKFHLDRGYEEFYCKDDNCVSTRNRSDLNTIEIPNKEGKKITYITDTCSPLDISLGLCFSKSCTSDSQCLSNKCMEGHCSFNEDNPIVHCQYVRKSTNHKLYQMRCGLPRGAKCKSNKDCSSRQCVNYKLHDNNKICEERNDNGCTSLCSSAIIMMAINIYILPLMLIGCCFSRFMRRWFFIIFIILIIINVFLQSIS
ncbi:hypothetical protein BCR32DRAFT_296849 [Anaeromyces robustus]|uniref:Uncharacterized protein n=1 Tax=Anaeromyces robustus TaxID=1754192 RepID=A0A1Y1WPP8_9FUNG|nr:hypothetical protein BCR32DRAFT_296849 [Anaeromyces robustus]|eukprot:ORX75511.1 hypothetical protein BCR32DRAFT_296849 [Anaeromyces robustus]